MLYRISRARLGAYYMRVTISQKSSADLRETILTAVAIPLREAILDNLESPANSSFSTYDTGKLAQGLQFDVQKGEIILDADYAKVVEYGTKPYGTKIVMQRDEDIGISKARRVANRPNFQRLMRWIRMKKGESGKQAIRSYFRISNHLVKHGLRAKAPVRTALDSLFRRR